MWRREKNLIITTLLENTTLSKDYKNKHGLCLHIKTKCHSILFDLGPDDTFIKNANKLNIEISEVDIVVISHGHKDHGGGLEAFLKNNNKAKIYIHKNAFKYYYTSILSFIKHYVGLNIELQNNDRIILVEDNFSIDDNMYLFSNVASTNLVPSSNKSFFMKEKNKYMLDDFSHEQNLILKYGNKYTLVAGCAHNGITNTLEKSEEIIGKSMDSVISGFHLFNPVSRKSEDGTFIERIGDNLALKNTTFYTCHCTGTEAFETLKKKLGNQINYLSTGQIIEV